MKKIVDFTTNIDILFHDVVRHGDALTESSPCVSRSEHLVGGLSTSDDVVSPI